VSVSRRSSFSVNNLLSREELQRRFGELQNELDGDISELPLTLSVRIDEINLLQWLHTCGQSPRFYWSSRDGKTEIAGYGSALRIESADIDISAKECFDRAERIISLCDDDSVVFLGGSRFDTNARRGREWDGFHNAQFALPEVSIQRNDGDYFVCFAATLRVDSTIDQVLSRLESSVTRLNLRTDATGAVDHAVISRIDTPDPSGWTLTIDAYLDLIKRGQVDKIVAARRTDFEFAEPVDPSLFLDELLLSNRSCFGFMFEPQRGHAFVGASPERLFRLHSGRIETEALSGTAARAETDEANGSTGRDLLANDKNLREHRFVLDDITSKMDALCESRVDRDDLSLMKLSNVMHIYAKLSGAIRSGVSIGDVVSCMHPTPAVGGVPCDKALEITREYEPFDRGWFAAPVGIIRRDFAEMAVAIRSALIVENNLSIYAGAGIVDGSESRSEWMELEHKIAPALKLLGGVLV